MGQRILNGQLKLNILSGFPEGSLVKRQKNRREEKLALDCYVIHMFLNGDNSENISSVISASGRTYNNSVAPSVNYSENNINSVSADVVKILLL